MVTSSSLGTERISSNHPSERASLTPTRAAMATSALSSEPGTPRHVSYQRVDEAAPDPLQRRNADLIGDVTTDKCLPKPP